jgi:hypothetical protein
MSSIWCLVKKLSTVDCGLKYGYGPWTIDYGLTTIFIKNVERIT